MQNNILSPMKILCFHKGRIYPRIMILFTTFLRTNARKFTSMRVINSDLVHNSRSKFSQRLRL